MGCGEDYYHQYVFTTDDCGLICTEADVNLALIKLRELRAKLVEVWNAVLPIEEKNQVWPFYEAWNGPMTSWMALDEYPEKWDLVSSAKFAIGDSGAVDAISGLARDGCCLLEKMNEDARAKYGLNPAPAPHEPPPPKPEETPVGQISGAIKAVVVGGVIIAAIFAAVKLAK